MSVDVLPGWRQADGTHVAGLRLTLAPGWKTYWRVPGEAGIPPEFSWRGSRNLSSVRVVWPTPRVFDQLGSQSIGYYDKVVLPLAIAVRDPSAPVQLKGKVQIGVCSDICVPTTLKVAAALPAGGSRMPEISAALSDQPLAAGKAGVTAARCRIRPIEGGLSIEAAIDLPSAGAPEAVVIEPSDPQLYVTQAATDRQGKRLSATSRVYHVDGGTFLLSRQELRLTVIGSNHAVDIRGCSGF
ncbi:protein-disulfide reductase DsbD domain-containing protein [Pseudaestuariivita atlantica]|uniref:protein-disulfide reductase DsbD domain-containing protein n=1 Tax=Pseudaestuariivita atlantica TaxID=1317121 RepID=UPI0013F45EFA|nr:protein-disulfide reductase DsbD domain-containing protein [Pseudaestuariivita atlantica]